MKPKWKQLKEKGWKVYNNGYINKMFPSYKEAIKYGFTMEGFTYGQNNTKFHYREL